MTSDLMWRFIGCIVPLIGSAIQMWGTIQKRSNWINRSEQTVNRLGSPFTILDKVPLRISRFLLIAVLILSLFALYGGVLISTNKPPKRIFAFLFENSLWLTFSFLTLAVVTYLNGLARLFLIVSRIAGSLWPSLTYHPGWINAYWHIRLEEEAVPINTNINGCEQVANDYVKAVAIDGVDYGKHRATKPPTLSGDELANFLVITNAIESELHRFNLGDKILFANLYSYLGEAGQKPERPFSPPTLSDSITNKVPLYRLLRKLIPTLPDEPAIETMVTKLVSVLVVDYSARALGLAKISMSMEADSAVLDSRLQQLPAFTDTQAMRAQVIKLGNEWNVWPGMKPGPFIYPFSKSVARLLLNLDCIRTRPDVKTIPCDDEFSRLTAWTLDRIVDGVLKVFKDNTDDRIVDFCNSRFGCPPSDVQRWSVSREVDYFLWVQAQETNPEGGVFGKKSITPWKIEGDNLIKG